MWYYDLNQQPFGPVSKETIADEFKAGRITAQTRVWREGWPEWKKLGETELASLAGLTPPVVEAVQPAPTFVNIPQYKKVDPKSLTRLFWWWFGLILFSIPIYLLSLMIKDQTWVIGLVCVFEIPLMAGGVLQYILVYKFWQILQDGFARTTPGKAVGFMFIPFFNFYWLFVAYYGLSKDQDAYIKRHFNEFQTSNIRKPHPGLSLGFVIFGWAFVLFYFVLMVIIIGKTISALSNPMAMADSMQPFSLVFSIFGAAQLILMITVLFDFFLTAISILKAEGNQAQ
jgi:hypothetical protein